MSRLRNTPVVEVIPSARRLVTSLRDIGYDFVHAVADLVDNSIAAKAGRVLIDLRFDGPDSWLRVADDGAGMSGTTITEAMRYGSQRDYEDDELGKFGLGLKTASMSQCRRLSVGTRTDPQVNRVEARQLDLDHIEKSDRWDVFVIPADDRPPILVEPLEKGPGTVVVWQALDRVLWYKLPWGEKARAGLLKLTEQLELHLGMVFHRFLSGQVRRRRKLSISVNGVEVTPWDPFALDEKHTESLPGDEIEINASSGAGIVRYQPYVLPPRERFSNEHAFERLGGPARWNAQQGFYIYRANRLIQSGGWCRMRTADEHTKLARAAIDFFPDLDSAFEVNVSKVRVGLPAQLRERLQPHVEMLVRRAQATYRQSSRRDGPAPSPKHGPSSSPRAGRSNRKVRTVRKALERAAADTGESRALSRIMNRVAETDPEMAHALGW